MTNRPLASHSDVTNHSSWICAGIPGLLLGQGAQVADMAAAADAVDALPLGQAGFTPETLAAARDFLLKADPSESGWDGQRGMDRGTCWWAGRWCMLHSVTAWQPLVHSRPCTLCAELAPMIAEHGAPDRLLKKVGPNFPTLAKAIVFQASASQLARQPSQRLLSICGSAVKCSSWQRHTCLRSPPPLPPSPAPAPILPHCRSNWPQQPPPRSTSVCSPPAAAASC